MIAALFVETNGIYYGLPDVDPWDEARDARKYSGPWPVVAHPPCSRWCRLAGLVEHRYGIMRGDDDGCFKAALDAVRRFGGVLEHPAYSDAFPAYALPRPERHVWTRELMGPGYVTEISQCAYGHRARKRTWLYAVGTDLPSLDWSEPEDSVTGRVSEAHGETRRGGRAWVSFGDYEKYGHVERLSKRERNATPLEFRDMLLAMARSVQHKEMAQ